MLDLFLDLITWIFFNFFYSLLPNNYFAKDILINNYIIDNSIDNFLLKFISNDDNSIDSLLTENDSIDDYNIKSNEALKKDLKKSNDEKKLNNKKNLKSSSSMNKNLDKVNSLKSDSKKTSDKVNVKKETTNNNNSKSSLKVSSTNKTNAKKTTKKKSPAKGVSLKEVKGKAPSKNSKSPKVTNNKSSSESKSISKLEMQLMENNKLLENMKEEMSKFATTIQEATKSPEDRKAEAIKKFRENEIKRQIAQLQSQLEVIETSTIDIFKIEQSLIDTKKNIEVDESIESKPKAPFNKWDRSNFLISNDNVFDPNEYNETNLNDYEEHERKINELKNSSMFNAESSIDQSYNYLNLQTKSKKINSELELEQGSPFLGEIYDEENNNTENRLDFLSNDLEEIPKEVSMSKFQSLNNNRNTSVSSEVIKKKISSNKVDSKVNINKKPARMSEQSQLFRSDEVASYKNITKKNNVDKKDIESFEYPKSSIIDNLEFQGLKKESSNNNPREGFNYEELRVSSYEEGLKTPESTALKRQKTQKVDKDISNLSTDEQLKIISTQAITRKVSTKQDTLESLISKISNNALTEEYLPEKEDDFDFSIGDPEEVIVPIKEDGTVDFAKAGISLEQLETKPIGKNTNPFKDSNWTDFQESYISKNKNIVNTMEMNSIEKEINEFNRNIKTNESIVPERNVDPVSSSELIEEYVSRGDYERESFDTIPEDLLSATYEKGKDINKDEEISKKNIIDKSLFLKKNFKLSKKTTDGENNDSSSIIFNNKSIKSLSPDQVVSLIKNGKKMNGMENYTDDDFKKLEVSLPGDNSKVNKKKNADVSNRPEFFNKKPKVQEEAKVKFAKKLKEDTPTKSKYKKSDKSSEGNSKAEINKGNYKNTTNFAKNSVDSLSGMTSEFSDINGFSFNKPKPDLSKNIGLTSEQRVQSKLYIKSDFSDKGNIDSIDEAYKDSFKSGIKKVESNPFYKLNYTSESVKTKKKKIKNK